jgi:hypothetical protein
MNDLRIGNKDKSILQFNNYLPDNMYTNHGLILALLLFSEIWYVKSIIWHKILYHC